MSKLKTVTREEFEADDIFSIYKKLSETKQKLCLDNQNKLLEQKVADTVMYQKSREFIFSFGSMNPCTREFEFYP